MSQFQICSSLLYDCLHQCMYVQLSFNKIKVLPKYEDICAIYMMNFGLFRGSLDIEYIYMIMCVCVYVPLCMCIVYIYYTENIYDEL